MQKECPQCGKQFESRRGEPGELCPSCARGGFRRATASETPSPEWEKQQKAMLRKQMLRARKLGRIELEKKGWQAGHVVMLLLSGALAATAVLLFWISSRSDAGILANMPAVNQRIFSLFLNASAAVLLFLALKRRPLPAVAGGVALLVWGWFVPVLWPSGERVLTPSPSVTASAPAENRRATVLGDEELRILDDAASKCGMERVWGVYVEAPSDGAREQIRKFLTRLSRASRVIAYSRGNGLLFVLEGTPATAEEMRAVAVRLGTLLSLSPERRLVETRFDARESHYENEYSSDILLTVAHPSFVRANLSELYCFDPARIVSAAQNLETAHTEDFHADIRTALLDVLREPWTGQEYVPKALVQALLAYTEPDDYQVLAEVRRLFDVFVNLNIGVPGAMMDYLVQNDPESMVEPLIRLWVGNSVYWEPWLTKLGSAAQPQLLSLLAETESLQTIGGILRHLEREGTPEALPAIRQFENHGDGLIRKAARDAAAEIGRRAAKNGK